MRRGLTLLAVLPALLITACARPDGPGAPPDRPDAVTAFERRAAQVAQNWRDADLTTAWRAGFVPLEDLTVEPERGFPDGDAKAAASAGWFTLAGTLPTAAGRGAVAFPGGGSLDVPLVSATEAFKALAFGGRPQCEPAASPAPQSTAGPDGSVSSPVQPCTTLTVTAAKLGTVPLRTSRGAATVPAWIFTIKEMPDPMARVAVAPQSITPVPEPAVPDPQPETGLVSTQGLTKADGKTIAYQLGVGACDENIRPLVWESADVIVVGGAVDPPKGDLACVAMLKMAPVEVSLAQPVGERIILDAIGGRPVLSGPY